MLDPSNFPRLYWNVALTAFFGLALWESYRPRHPRRQPIGRRWAQHLALAVAGALVGVALRTSPLVVAVAAPAWSGGLAASALPFWVQCVAGFLALDATRYVQHRLLHAVPLLWRLHQVHHSDEDFDLTTGLRFHPLEALATQGSYLLVIAAIAPPVEAVLVAEVVTIAQNFFAHANARLPRGVERRLRRVLVTPELHRLHHSVDVSEQNTNFGSVFPWWDHLGRTYPADPLTSGPLAFGLREIAPGTRLTLARLLGMPFGGAR